MTAMVMDVRELTGEELDSVTGGIGPVGAAVGGIIGAVAGAGTAAASGNDAYGIVAGAVVGGVVGAGAGLVMPGGGAGLAAARSMIRTGQVSVVSGVISGGFSTLLRNLYKKH